MEGAQETTQSVDSTTEEVLETTNSQSTESGQETTNAAGEQTTAKPKPPSNNNSSCPPLEEGQAHFVCPTGFKRHPQDCEMFYQCTRSPETSHLSIVTFNCPNGTVYDEDAIQCRDKTENDNCPSKSQDGELRGTLLDLERNDSPVVSFFETFIRIETKIVPNFLDTNSN